MVAQTLPMTADEAVTLLRRTQAELWHVGALYGIGDNLQLAREVRDALEKHDQEKRKAAKSA